MRTEGGPCAGAGGEETSIPTSNLLKATARDDKMRSPSSDSIKSHATGEGSVIVKTGNGILRTPIVLQKPRPWSVVGSEPKASGELVTGNGNADSTKTTPDNLEEGGSTKIKLKSHSRKTYPILLDEVEVVAFGSSSGGSIVGITPGIALTTSTSGGGSIVGITPGRLSSSKHL